MTILEYASRINLSIVSLIVLWVSYAIMFCINSLFLFHNLVVEGRLDMVQVAFVFFWVYQMWELRK